jgi:thiamine-monophosphate kinase
MREDQLIAKISAKTGSRTRSKDALLAIGDDTARWVPKPGYEVLLTSDWFLEGTHFLRDKHAADSVGWKCLARAASDIAAMGGTPVCFLMSLALPTSLAGRWLDRFLAGLRRAAQRFGCPLAGGDTTRRNEVLISLTVVGQIAAGRSVLRSGARPGDVVFVSGTLGEAELGLSLVRGNAKATRTTAAMQKHLYPEPRLALGKWLAEKRLVSAMMDLSDGLSTDLPRLAAASSAGAWIDAGALPAVQIPASRASQKLDALDLALHGGDDYELLFAVPKQNVPKIPASFQGLPLSAIGEIRRGHSLVLRGKNGRDTVLPNKGWDPFRNKR